MNSNKNQPMDPEIEQLSFDKKYAQSIGNLEYIEKGLMLSLKELAGKLKESNAELQKCLEAQNETHRNYIQLVNRKSDVVKAEHLASIKNKIKQRENQIATQLDISNTILDLVTSYKEYKNTLGDVAKIMDKLNKTQGEWHQDAADLAKAKSQDAVSGSKLDKIEKNMGKHKQEVIKLFQEKTHKEGFLDQALTRVSLSWGKLKNSIRNFA